MRNNTTYQRDFTLFTPGPVQMSEDILRLGAKQPPYFRTHEFSETTHEIITGLRSLLSTAGEVVIFTSSGTGAMEAAVINFFSADDTLLIIEGGGFGARWTKICQLHRIPYEVFITEPGRTPDYDTLDEKLSGGMFTGLLLNAHETTTGYLYDTEKIGALAAANNVLFVVDAISTVLADEFYMDQWQVDVTVLSSQKGLAVPPGLSFIALNKKAASRLNTIDRKTFYFNIPEYLKNLKRGQLPFTCAVSLMTMLHKQLELISMHGIQASIAACKDRAQYFRNLIEGLPFQVFPERSSNAITCLKTEDGLNAELLVSRVREEYNIFLTPNAPPMAEHLFRVSHLGEQTNADLERLAGILSKVLL